MLGTVLSSLDGPSTSSGPDGCEEDRKKKKKKKIKDERGQRNSQSWQRAEVSEDQGRNGEQMSRDRQVKGGRSEGRKWGGDEKMRGQDRATCCLQQSQAFKVQTYVKSGF